MSPMRLEIRQWLLVSETFVTLQGEGRSAGQRALFIRLGGCDQHCTWCDSNYTWAFDERHAAMTVSGKQFDPKEELSRMSIVDAAELIRKADVELVVITGGEPMLQVDTLDLLISLVNESPRKHRFEIETAGIHPPGPLSDYENVAFNVSPKLEHSGNELELRRNIGALIDLVGLDSIFKFVVGPLTLDADIREIEERIGAAKIPAGRIWLMPLGTEVVELIAGMQLLAPIVMENRWNLTGRLHILLWGNERGR